MNKLTPAQKKWIKYFNETENARVHLEFFSKKPLIVPAYVETSMSVLEVLKKECDLIVCPRSIIHATTLYIKRKDAYKY